MLATDIGAGVVRREFAAAPILRLTGIAKSFGSLVVLKNVELSVIRGEILGILGPNGAGKSTLFNVIAGVMRPTAGLIMFDGQDIAHAKVWARARLGIGRTYQIPKPFRQMTVFEHALVAATQARRLSIGKAHADAAAVVDLTGLSDKADVWARDLSLLDLKRLEFAKALAVHPKLLLLDEIAGGLTDGECDVLLEIVRRVNEQGTTIVWIEHVIHVLARAVDRLAVLYDGAILAEGDPTSVLESNAVRQVYLGT